MSCKRCKELRQKVKEQAQIIAEYRGVTHNFYRQDRWLRTPNPLADTYLEAVDKAIKESSPKHIKVNCVRMNHHTANGIIWNREMDKDAYYMWVMLRVEAEIGEP